MLLIHSLGGGGAERVAVDLSAAWVARGYRVSLVTQAGRDKDAYTVAEGVERHVLGTGDFAEFRASIDGTGAGEGAA